MAMQLCSTAQSGYPQCIVFPSGDTTGVFSINQVRDINTVKDSLDECAELRTKLADVNDSLHDLVNDQKNALDEYRRQQLRSGSMLMNKDSIITIRNIQIKSLNTRASANKWLINGLLLITAALTGKILL